MKEQFENYNVKKNRVIELLDECACKIQDEKLLKNINEKKSKLQEERFVVSVFGHFSNGKSTFLNSLMGFDHEVLKEDDNASTATITRLKYVDSSDDKCNKVDVIFRDNSTDRIEMDELTKYVARNSEVDVEQTISEVVLYVDSPFLKNGVEIVDTPGFNSTYEIHSEIALQQVEKSDAAIFLFSVDQPGNGEEFEFLKRVSRYMERIFFVLNKVDKSDDNGITEKNDIYKKMQRIGIDVSEKTMYMLSALRAREAIVEHDEEKLNVSGMKTFESSLVHYLTGEDFVKDRLLAPLVSVFSLIECEKKSILDQINACSKDRNELNVEIQNRKKEVRERENELNNNKRHIVSSVRSEIQSAKSDVRGVVTEVENFLSERLENINSKFDIRLANFEELNTDTYIMFNAKWEEKAEEFEKSLLDILNELIDSEEEYNKIEDAISVAIRSHLVLEKICVDNPDFDFTELSKIDEEISKSKEEYEKAYRKVSNLYALKDDKNTALSEIEKIESELERLRNKKEKRIESLKMVPVEYGCEMKKYDAYVKRSRIGQFFLGDKRIEREKRVEYEDTRAHDAAMKEVSKIEEELEKSSFASKDKVKKIRDSINSVEYKQIEREIAHAEAEERELFDELINKRGMQKEEKRKLELDIITVEKDKYLRELKKCLEDMGKSIIIFLDRSQKNFVSILSTCLDREYEAIEREKNGIEKMVSINDQSPEEIERKIVELNQVNIALTECMKKIELEKERI